MKNETTKWDNGRYPKVCYSYLTSELLSHEETAVAIFGRQNGLKQAQEQLAALRDALRKERGDTMKKLFIIADHLWGTVTIRTVTDKDIVLDVIKKRIKDFAESVNILDKEIVQDIDNILSFESLPRNFFCFIREHDDEGMDAQSIFLKVEDWKVTFQAERDENNISTAIETHCLCEFMEEE